MQERERLIIMGGKIRAQRLIKKMSFDDLAKITGLNGGRIAKIENGEINIRYFTMIKISDALGITASELVSTVFKRL